METKEELEKLEKFKKDAGEGKCFEMLERGQYRQYAGISSYLDGKTRKEFLIKCRQGATIDQGTDFQQGCFAAFWKLVNMSYRLV